MEKQQIPEDIKKAAEEKYPPIVNLNGIRNINPGHGAYIQGRLEECAAKRMPFSQEEYISYLNSRIDNLYSAWEANKYEEKHENDPDRSNYLSTSTAGIWDTREEVIKIRDQYYRICGITV